MSKSKRELPPPGEMRDVDVQFVSLVTKAANKKRFTLFKSADYEEDETASEEEAKQAVGFLQHVKKFFMGGDEEHQEIAKADATTAVAEPATFGAVIAQEEARSQMWRIFDAISTVFWNIFRSQSSNKRKLLETSLDEFKAKVLENFDKLTQVKVAKGEEGEEYDIEKAGAKISATRLKALEEAHAYLTKVITEAKGDGAAATGTEAAVTKQDEEEIDMKKEELQAIMKSAVEEAVKPLQERLDKIEKGDEGEGDPAAAAAGDDSQELTAASVAEIVKSAVGEATKDLGERLTRVEKARGLSNQPDDEGEGQQRQVQKSADSEWGGLFSI